MISVEKHTDNAVVLVTVANEPEGTKLAKLLVERRLAACVSLIPGVKSFFWWEGEIDEESELLLVIKTAGRALEKLIETVQANHSYSVPEIIALPIMRGSEQYLSWLNQEVQP